jgi:hypothetical protein
MGVGAVECSIDGDETVVLCDDRTHATFDTAETQDQNNSVTSEERSYHNNNPKTKIVQAETIDEDEESLLDLSWRLDPIKSLSDWTIQVQTLAPRKAYPVDAKNSHAPNVRLKARVDVYHVHKSVLGVGPRRSRYFARAFIQHEVEKKKRLDLQQKQTNDVLFLRELLEESLDMVKMHSFVSIKCGVGSSSKASTSSSQAPLSVLELEAPAAEAFPALLDYLYSSRLASSAPVTPKPESSSLQQAPTDLVEVSTHSATALHHLSVLLQIKPLQRITTKFYTADLSIDNLMVYYTHARIFDDAPVLERAAKVLAASILDMEQKIVIYFLQALDAEFFFMVLQLITQEHNAVIKVNNEESHKVEDKTLSVRLSLLVAIYCNLHRDELGEERLTMFERLTGEQLIPVLDVKAAQVLLDIEQGLKDDSTLTSLKRRCIEIIAHHWDSALVSIEDDNDPAGDGCSGRILLPPVNGEALCHFTLMALTRAKAQLDSREGKTQETACDIEAPLGLHPLPRSLRRKAIPSLPNKTESDELLGQMIISSTPMEEATGDSSELEPLSE